MNIAEEANVQCPECQSTDLTAEVEYKGSTDIKEMPDFGGLTIDENWLNLASGTVEVYCEQCGWERSFREDEVTWA